MLKRHILVVDDDAFAGSILVEYLRAEGFEVTIANTCAEGKQVLSAGDPVDLVILDHFLPDDSGVELLQSMARDQSLQKPRVVLSSSWIDPNDVTWRAIFSRLPALAQSLVLGYLPKPYHFKHMNALLATVRTTPRPPQAA
jgi:CheY-like chemotaxis protein